MVTFFENLPQRLMKIYPELTWMSFMRDIVCQDNNDGNGEFIKEWNHPTLSQPTDEQIASVVLP